MKTFTKLVYAAISAMALLSPISAGAAVIVDIPAGGSWGSAIGSGFITGSQSTD